MLLPLALALLAQPAPEPAGYAAVVRSFVWHREVGERRPDPPEGKLVVDVLERPDGDVVSERTIWIHGDAAHRDFRFWTVADPAEEVAPESLRPGDRLTVVLRPGLRPDADPEVDRVLVHRPGPHAFDVAVEDWVILATGCRGDCPRAGPLDRRAVADLGSPAWWRRQAATDYLRGRGDAALVPLLHARRSVDPEVRERAARLLAGLGVR